MQLPASQQTPPVQLPIPVQATSPQAAIAAAIRQRNVDLSNHRSRCFTNTIPVEADLVIVFDEANEEAVIARYPDVDAKLFWLSDFLNGTEQGAPVLDPYGLTATEYDVSYRLIERGVDALVATLGVSVLKRN